MGAPTRPRRPGDTIRDGMALGTPRSVAQEDSRVPGKPGTPGIVRIGKEVGVRLRLPRTFRGRVGIQPIAELEARAQHPVRTLPRHQGGDPAPEAAELETVSLLLSDVRLPGKAGTELAMQLAPDFPTLRIVLMSGLVEDPTQRAIVSSGRFTLLQKPFSPDGLARCLRTALETPQPISASP